MKIQSYKEYSNYYKNYIKNYVLHKSLYLSRIVNKDEYTHHRHIYVCTTRTWLFIKAYELLLYKILTCTNMTQIKMA